MLATQPLCPEGPMTWPQRANRAESLCCRGQVCGSIRRGGIAGRGKTRLLPPPSPLVSAVSASVSAISASVSAETPSNSAGSASNSAESNLTPFQSSSPIMAGDESHTAESASVSAESHLTCSQSPACCRSRQPRRTPAESITIPRRGVGLGASHPLFLAKSSSRRRSALRSPSAAEPHRP